MGPRSAVLEDSIKVQFHRRAIIDTGYMGPVVAGDSVEAVSVTHIANPIAIYRKSDPSVRIDHKNVAALVKPALPLRNDLMVLPSPYSRIDPRFGGHGGRKSETGSIGDLDER